MKDFLCLVQALQHLAIPEALILYSFENSKPKLLIRTFPAINRFKSRRPPLGDVFLPAAASFVAFHRPSCVQEHEHERTLSSHQSVFPDVEHCMFHEWERKENVVYRSVGTSSGLQENKPSNLYITDGIKADGQRAVLSRAAHRRQMMRSSSARRWAQPAWKNTRKQARCSQTY